MTKNLTEGKPLPLILRFAVPLILGNLFQQFYNLVDAMIVGRYLGINELSAVGASASVNFLILGFCCGVCVGFGIPVAQEFGANNYSRMREYVFNSFYMSAVIAVIMTLVTALLCDDILKWMKTPDLIKADAYTYQLIIFLGIPFTILYNVLASIIRAMGDSKTPFYFLLLSTGCNVVLDLFCIIVLKMGVAGAGVATITSQGISGVACLIYMRKKYDVLKSEKNERKFISARSIKLLAMGIPMGLQSSITAIGSIMLQTAVNSLGTIAVAGYAAALKIKSVFISPFDAVGSAVATFCGQNLGAGKTERIRKGIRSGLVIAVTWSLIAFTVLQLFTVNIAELFVDASETDVLALVKQFMHTTSYFYFGLGFLLVYRYSVQGLGYSRLAMLAGFTEMVARTCMSLFVIPVFGFKAVCFTDQTAWFSAAGFSIAAFYIIYNRIDKRRPEHV